MRPSCSGIACSYLAEPYPVSGRCRCTVRAKMDGLDHAAPIDALRRRLRRTRPPMASIAFRHLAWRGFERALDPLGAPRALAEAKPSRARDLEGFKDSLRS
jgi:hypothetical protein